MASRQMLTLLIPGSIIITALRDLTKHNVEHLEDFTNTKTSMEIDSKKDWELIRKIGVYAPYKEAGIRRLISERGDLSRDKKKFMLDNLEIMARFPRVEDRESATKFIVRGTS